MAAGQEYVWTFTAPDEGFYEFDTKGSVGDTVLSVKEETCDGTTIACGQYSDFENAMNDYFRGQATVASKSRPLWLDSEHV